jgi:catechol 2,3-dioxygenase-like lactoylglutathione lyase family enzyme
MIDHLTLTVQDVARSRAFYTRALAPIGYAVRMEFEGFLGMGPEGKPCFWLKQGEVPSHAMHLSFAAPDRPAVDAFHAAALAAGAADNGPPGLRTDYHPSYYAAFVFDPDGHNVEAVCHKPPAAARRAAPARAARKVSAKKAARKAPRAKARGKGAKRR